MTGLHQTVRRAGRGDRSRVASLYAEAFSDDPFHAWLFPELESRSDRLERWFGWLTANYLGHERVEMVDGSLAAATWHPPSDGADPWPADEDRRASFRSLSEEVFGARRKLVMEGFARIVECAPSTPHWYLATIGTRTAAQGQGLGRLLLVSVLRDCDATGVPAYLESSNPRNIRLYERHGFRVTGRIEMPDGIGFVTPMWRDPSAAG